MTLARLFLSTFSVLFFLAGPAAAAPDDDARAGYEAEKKGDFATALKLYLVAAQGGSTYGAYNAALIYHTAKGVPRNFGQAMKFYRMAADKGHADAQHAVGAMLENAEGTAQNLPEAVKWYRLAADQGQLESQKNLGVIYSTGGPGVAADPMQAYLWFDVASKADPVSGSRRDRVAARMTPDQVTQAKALAAAWKPKKS